jgi:RNA-directed DNA polymerase
MLTYFTGSQPKGENCSSFGKLAGWCLFLGMEPVSLSPQNKFSEATLEKVLASENVQSAWKRVKANHGAPGPDGVTIDEVGREFETLWQPVEEAIRSGTYSPAGFREISIPKPSGGERLLRIPSVIDRVALQATASVLNGVWEPVFLNRSFGYRLGLGPVAAVQAARQELDEGRIWAVNVDIRSFFDTVDLQLLSERIRGGLEDAPLINHVLRCVDAGAMMSGGDGRRVGVPQGSPLSPLLANIALHDFDQFAKSRGWAFLRYADDIVIFFESQEAAREAAGEISEFFPGELRLELNQEKTGIVAAPEVRFLGFAFRRLADGKFHPCLSPEARRAFREKVEELTEFRSGLAFEVVARKTGGFVRQWLAYFAYGGAHALVPRESLRAFARARLRGFQWLLWGDDETRVREMVALGVPEDQARRDVRQKLPTAEAARCGAISSALPNAGFARFGLANPNSSGQVSKTPVLKQADVQTRQDADHPVSPDKGPACCTPAESLMPPLARHGTCVDVTVYPDGRVTLSISAAKKPGGDQ